MTASPSSLQFCAKKVSHHGVIEGEEKNVARMPPLSSFFSASS